MPESCLLARARLDGHGVQLVSARPRVASFADFVLFLNRWRFQLLYIIPLNTRNG